MNKYYKFVISFVLLFAQFDDLAAQEISLVAVGDLNLGHWVEPILKKNGNDYPFKYVRAVLRKADVVFANLEAPFCLEGKPFDKGFVFKVSPYYVQTLIEGNINLVSLANNHIMDFGDSCLISTIQTLENANIYYAGAGINRSEAQKPAVLTIKEIKIALFAYSMTLPEDFFATKTSCGTAYPYKKLIVDNIAVYKKSYDLVIVSFHWGKELTESPQEYQIQMAHTVIDAGADLVLGHHPHVIQGLEIYKGKLICYSLGNFIFASYSDQAKVAIMVQALIADKRIARIEIIPINVNNYEVQFQPRIFYGSNKIKLLDYINMISAKLNKDLDILNSDGNLNILN